MIFIIYLNRACQIPIIAHIAASLSDRINCSFYTEIVAYQQTLKHW